LIGLARSQPLARDHYGPVADHARRLCRQGGTTFALRVGSLILLAASFVLLLVVANLKAAELREVSRRTILTAAGFGALAALAATMLLFGLRSNISQLRAW